MNPRPAVRPAALRNRQLIRAGVVVAAVAFASSSTVTASAHQEPAPFVTFARVVTLPPQTFEWAPPAEYAGQSIARDGFTATSPEELAETARTSAVSVASAGSSRAPFAAPQHGFSGAAVVAYAEQFVGVVPYGMGATPADGFSCDGLTQYVLARFGVHLPRSVAAQLNLGTRISQADARAGDLVVWPGAHVGIYDGAGGVVHSPVPGRFVEHKPSLWGNPVFVRL